MSAMGPDRWCAAVSNESQEQLSLASWRPGRRELLEDVTGGSKEGSEGWRAYLAANRCGSKARGSVYDTVAGICCHFCRQVRLSRYHSSTRQAPRP